MLLQLLANARLFSAFETGDKDTVKNWKMIMPLPALGFSNASANRWSEDVLC